ncbi:MAG: DUF5103 domain-containing protein [Bacteroidetes bacterium]|nr:DUF5103 domain-containing protein [Bacteroidota bacterium]
MTYLNIRTYSQAFRMTFIMILVALLFSFQGNKSMMAMVINSFSNDKPISADRNHIKSVIIHRFGFELSDPIIQLNTDEKLLLAFDDLMDEVKSYNYTIVHCNSNWEPSELLTAEYINGFASDQISDYQFSLNTTTSYIHYELIFPTDYLRLTKSGNYIIKVFEDNNQNELAFMRKFSIVNPEVKIEASIKPPLALKSKLEKQEIGFKIFLKNLYIPNPAASLKIIIKQNNRDDNMITDINPVRNQGDVLDYHFNNKSIFYGGNEFRMLNIKSLRYKAININAIDYFGDGYHISLFEDKARNRNNYTFENDLNGKKLIKTEDEKNSSTEANYCWVHFSLKASPELLNKDIFITGELTEGLPNENTKLIFNAGNGCFEGLLFLKQGYYDYQYIVKESGELSASVLLTEGSHYETNNEYSIFVYYRDPGSIYDQLIGYEKIIGPNN